MADRPSNIRGLLIDLDGVLYVGGDVIPGAKEALDALKRMGIQRRFVTNTTTRTAAAVVDKLGKLGFDVQADEVFSAVTATKQFLRSRGQGRPTIHAVVRDSVMPEFAEFPKDSESPEFVLIGDIGAAWSYPLMNTIFRQLEQGAELVAMHKNRFFQTDEGLSMDIGGFVDGLEFVSGKTAHIVGKPSPEFFQLGIDSMALPIDQVAMIGDDLESDVGGGQAAGLKGILVKTGKFRAAQLEQSSVKPDSILESIADLPAWLDGA